MDNLERFSIAKSRVLSEETTSCGFTVYQERAIHKTVKLYIEPMAEHHEVPLLDSVVDVCNDGGVFEVQTGSPLPLIPKIDKLLTAGYRVTLVFPYAAITRHRWLNRDTGELSPLSTRRIAPLGYQAIARSLYAIRQFIGRDGFSVRLLPLEVEEYRVLDGRGREKKRGATLIEKLPLTLIEDRLLAHPRDYLGLLPEGLSATFTAPEYKRATRSRSRYDSIMLKLLLDIGVIRREGKRANAYIYAVVSDTDSEENN